MGTSTKWHVRFEELGLHENVMVQLQGGEEVGLRPHPALLRPYSDAGEQHCSVCFVGHAEVGPPMVAASDSFIQYTFTVNTKASGTLEFVERYSTMYMRDQQLRQQGVLDHYDPPLIFPGKGKVLPWLPGTDKRIKERGEQLAKYYQRLVCEATHETLEILGSCWAPGYTLHENAPTHSSRVPPMAGSHDGMESMDAEDDAQERQRPLGDADISRLPPQEDLVPEGPAKTNAARWWPGLFVLLVAVMMGGGAMLHPTITDTFTASGALSTRRLPNRNQLDDMRANLQAAEASRRVDSAEMDTAIIAEVERANQAKAALEMRRAKLSADEEDRRRLEQANKEREKVKAAYEASMQRRRVAGQRHTYKQQDPVPVPARVEEKTSAAETIATKHGCTCSPTTFDRSDPSAPVEWDGCASRQT